MTDWSPFRVCPEGERPPSTRSILSREGLGDRLRTAAFAEFQAREAFRWAAARFADAAPALREAWEELARSEDKHFQMILARMAALRVDPAERAVSDALSRSLLAAEDATSFARLMRSAEERGRAAELRFQEQLAASDPETAAMFAEIAEDEAAHIALAARHFP